MSLEMARIAVADGIRVMACTPHIYPGLYQNHTAGITAARDALQAALDEQGIALELTTGADVHLVPPANLRIFRANILVDLNVAAEIAATLALILIVLLYRHA